LTYQDDEGQRKPVPKGYRNIIRIFKDYMAYRHNNGSPVGDDYNGDITEFFDAFRLDPSHRVGNITRTQPTQGSTRQTSTVEATNSNPALDNFKKGIKRDPTSFLTLKDKRFQDSWRKKFVTVIGAQDLDHVIDPDYVSADALEQEILDMKQKFVYSVLYDKVLTSNGKAILRTHFDKRDAEKAYAELLKHHTASGPANISARDIQNYFTTVKLLEMANLRAL
jgi:hypothetical protein